ncbi:hypothetical protein V1509DRAFT_601059 [Lipomyces kononenkoae]
MSSDAFQCSKCAHDPFPTKRKLDKHISDYHRVTTHSISDAENYETSGTVKSNGHACNNCGARFSTLSNLRRHMKRNCKGNQLVTENTNNQSVVHPANNCELEGDHISTDSSATCSIATLGLMIEEDWHVVVCVLCKFVIDKAHVIGHFKEKHKMDIGNNDEVGQLMRDHRLRPHLAVIWDEATEERLDESDDDDHGRPHFTPAAFRPGSVALSGIPVQDGFKCQLCEQRLHHVCVTTHASMRSHYNRHHPNEKVECQKVRVQAFYAPSNVRPQLRFVEVTDNECQAGSELSAFGIPQKIHSVPGHRCNVHHKEAR